MHYIIYYINRPITMKQALTLCLISAVMLLTACNGRHNEQPTAEQATPVKAITVNPAGAAASRDYVGTIEASVGSSLSFETAGTITRLYVDEGDAVRQGQVLATIDGASLRDIHEGAIAALDQARDAYKRYGNLHKQGTVPDVKWVEIESKLKQAESAERLARTNLSHAVLRAPFSGTIASRLVENGMNVAPGQPVLKLVQTGNVNVKIAVPENEITQWRVGQQATFTVAALGNQSFTARVSEKGVEADPAAHTYTVKLALANPSGRLMPGMVCRVLMPAAQRQTAEAATGSDILLPPRAVLLDENGHRFVWLAVNGKATLRRVEVGPLCADGILISAGLNDGDRVITEGNQKVSEGMAVKVI